MIAQNHVCVLRLSCIGVANCAARKVQIACRAMTSKTFLHNCDVCESECPNDASSMGPEISVIASGSIQPQDKSEQRAVNVVRYALSVDRHIQVSELQTGRHVPFEQPNPTRYRDVRLIQQRPFKWHIVAGRLVRCPFCTSSPSVSVHRPL